MKIVFLIMIFCLLAASLYAQSLLLVFKNVTVIDATGNPPLTEIIVIIKDNRIAEIGKSGLVKIPKGSKIIDATGKFLIPGLWDMHVHLAKTGENTLPLFIANGVTSVRDMGGDPALVLKWRQEIADGKRLGPRIKAAGSILESKTKIREMLAEKTIEPVERFRIGVGSPDEAFAAVDTLAKLGVDFIKIRTVESVETYRAIAEAAKKHGLMLVGHPSVSLEEIIRAGQRSIEHAIIPPLDKYSEAERKNLFQSFVQKDIAVVPTLVTGQESLLVPKKKASAIVEDAMGKLDFRRKYLSGYLIEDWREQISEREDSFIGTLEKIRPNVVRDLREMHRTGVRLMTGTDAGVALIYPGFTLHTELELLVNEVGLTPLEAIIAATRSPAEFFGMQKTLGTIEKGKIADLVLLEANPLADIRNTQKINLVILNGTLVNRQKINYLLKERERLASLRRK